MMAPPNWSYAHPSNEIDEGWHHVVFVWNDTDSQTNPGVAGYDIYLDGKLITIADGARFGTYGGNGSQIDVDHLRFGTRDFGHDPGGMPFAGRMDEAAIFSSSLSAADVTALYNLGKPTDLADPSSYDTPGMEDHLSNWWRMGDNDDAEAGAGMSLLTDVGSSGYDLHQAAERWQPIFSTSTP